MQMLFENPLPVLAIGGLTVAILISGLIKTGRMALLWGALAAIAVTGGLVLLERTVVTPVEEVETQLKSLANSIEANRVKEVTSAIAPAAEQLRSEATQLMKQVTIDKVKIKNNLEVELDKARPNQATARFNAVVKGSDKSGTIENGTGAWYFVVNFAKQGDTWLVTDYERHDPLEGRRE